MSSARTSRTSATSITRRITRWWGRPRSEAYGGRHWNALNGVNVDAGIFLSYIGLFSYYNADNWAYQPSYVSSNTPWFFTGLRLQVYTCDKLKIEPWLINGWQSYGMFNEAPGVGGQILYRPNGSVSMLTNDYYGRDALALPHRRRFHTDNSIEVKYFDAGCESGDGVSCARGDSASPAQNFLGFMLYNRSWFNAMTNPGRYLVLLPPVNGATAYSGTPYFTDSPGDGFKAWDASVTLDYMPDDYTTFRFEINHRAANVPYFAGAGGITPPGGNTGAPGSMVQGFVPDLRRTETRLNLALLIKL